VAGFEAICVVHSMERVKRCNYIQKHILVWFIFIEINVWHFSVTWICEIQLLLELNDNY
jgi:hypothetical protein